MRGLPIMKSTSWIFRLPRRTSLPQLHRVHINKSPKTEIINMADLKSLASRLGTDGPVKVLPTEKRIRVLFKGVYIFDTTSSILVWEHPYYPYYYLPADSTTVSFDKRAQIAPGVEQATLRVGEAEINSLLLFSDSFGEQGSTASALRGMVRVEFRSADTWYEEDTPVFVHPKDPFKRVDIFQSSRVVRVFIDGVKVAEATHALHLYETGLPTRFYLPPTSVDPSLLRPSTTQTSCPYKGDASYYSIEVNRKVYEDIVWYYKSPIIESAAIIGQLCFYNEKVDIELDGKMTKRPVSKFS